MRAGRPSVSPSGVHLHGHFPLITISRDAVYPYIYLVKGFQLNLPQIVIVCVEVAERVSKVRGHRSRS